MVGCEIGMSNAQRAKMISRYIIIETFAISFFLYFFIYVFRKEMAEAYTNDEEVIAMVYDLLLWVVPVNTFVMNISFMWSAFFIVLQKAHVSQNLQLLQGVTTFPFVWYFAFYQGMEVKGCYIAITISALFVLIPSWYYTHYKYDWEEIVRDIQRFHLKQSDKLIPKESDQKGDITKNYDGISEAEND